MADQTTPGYGDVQQTGRASGGAFSGTGSSADATDEPGQYPARLFGVPLPSGTGAPGTAGAGGASDPTNEPGQLTEAISGTGPADTAQTGAPGSQGVSNTLGSGADTIKFTRPGAFLTGTNTQNTVADNISGPDDWTQANDGSYAGGRFLPGIEGNMPQAGSGPFQPGSGRVLRGGYRKGQR